MKRIVFSGYLRDLYPDGIEVEAETAAEAVSALALWPGFRPADNVRHSVVMPQFGSKDALYARTDEPVLLVVPMQVLSGGKGGLFQVIIGAVLIAVGFILGPGTPWGAGLIKVGASLMIGGVIQMLMPQPEIGSTSQEEKSAYLPAGRNTTKVGTRIPLLFGRRRVWGHFLSVNVTASNKPKPVKPPAGSVYASNSTFSGYNKVTESPTPPTGGGDGGEGGG